MLADERDRPRSWGRGLVSGGAPGELEERRGERNAHDRGVHASVPARGRARRLLADAVGRGEKVLVLRAPGEDASILDRSLAAAGLSPSVVVGSGQVEVLDSARWRAQSGGRAQRLTSYM